MSRLEELINELCPDGVQYVTLEDISTDMFRGTGITRNQITDNGTPCVRYGEIYTTYGICFDKCVSYTNEELLSSKKYFEFGDILFAITGESVEDIAKSCAYLGNEKCLAGGDIVVLKHNQNPKYISYALSTTSARMQKSKNKVKNKVVHSSIPSIKEIIIPLPPLEIQQEIVHILDNLTDIIEKLKTKLQEEITARKKQYEYYCKEIFLFKNNKDIKWVRLSEIADIGTGSSNTKEGVEVGKYPFFVRSQEVRRKNEFEFDETAIITAGDGVGVGKVFHYVEGKYALHQRAYRIHINSNIVIDKYFYYYMKGTFLTYIEKMAVNSSVTSIRRKMLDDYQVPITSLEEQRKIIDILDMIEQQYNNISETLRVEIKARQKQYEYYRDKIFSFKELKKEGV